MKLLPLVIGGLLACSLHAQLSTLPPSEASSYDPFENRVEWARHFHALATTGNSTSPIETLASWDGITMGGSGPVADLDLIGVRVIYLGNTTASDLAFGYTFGSGMNPARSRTLIPGTGSGPTAFTYWDLPVTRATVDSLDFWLNVAPGATGAGGLFHAYHPEWNQGTGGSAHWSRGFLLDTIGFDIDLGDVATRSAVTHLLTFEDGQQGAGDADRSDLIFAVQLIQWGGHPTVILPGVPEPAAFGAAGAVSLVGAMLVRRFWRRAAA